MDTGLVKKYSAFNTPLGWTAVMASREGLLAVTLPHSSEAGALGELGEAINRAERSPLSFVGLAERLQAYFSGRKVDFPDLIDLSGATPFQRQVWQAARMIPYGETQTYLWIARRIGKPGAARAVGQALGRNPLLIVIPCHRVVASGGGLGGFGGGLEMKRRLLKLEGVSY